MLRLLMPLSKGIILGPVAEVVGSLNLAPDTPDGLLSSFEALVIG